MNQSFYIVTLLAFSASMAFTQTREDFRSMKEQKAAEIAALQASIAPSVEALQAEIDGIQVKIDSFPNWQTGMFGTLGYNLSSFNNWVKGANPNALSSSIRTTFNVFANYNEPKFFWRNSGGLNLGWLKLDVDQEVGPKAKFEQVADILRLTSLFGYKLTDKIALSALADYNSSILSNFNNPGIFDLGVGATWTPIPDMVVVVHPINMHAVFGDNPNFGSGLGTKLVVDYTRKLMPGVTWKTNLGAFMAYQSTDPTLSEWTWINSIAFTAWKGIGVGFEFGLRKAEVESPQGQNFWVIGLSYSL